MNSIHVCGGGPHGDCGDPVCKPYEVALDYGRGHEIERHIEWLCSAHLDERCGDALTDGSIIGVTEVGEGASSFSPAKEDQVVTETAKRERNPGTSEGTMVPRDGLVAGLRLVARYKGVTYHAEVVDEGGRIGVRIDGSIIVHDSLSSAGKGVTGGSVNGWRFWQIDTEEPAINFPAPEPEKRKRGRPRKVAAPVLEEMPASVDEYARGLGLEPASPASDPTKPLSEGGPFNHGLYGWN